ncbi:MAG: tRNA uridine-5-carboxymethylaminomethyl(34) synthesis GTPase MnmE [Bacteroidetes bacterium]|nr:tRNA uridine-5-carboxymethylaminomethyl(34) synthesis GTPase MnmE [Bacteroidota bacterium]MBU2585466.1 tRNA uridine-5-carboxymethylaminomethyl(34) synthesis GTPase MnmE [Bacteroidota bacterium]
MTQNEDTICAIITPPGIGAVSVIRVSGPKAIEIGNKIFFGKSKLKDVASYTIHYGSLEQNIDNVLVSVFRSPNSYTGEDSIEISYHGSSLISKKILELLISNQARLAEPGEFTKRAFLNGKLDLLQAEAVAEIIQSRSDTALFRSKKQLDGFLSKKIDTIKNYLVEAMGLIELELDFVEEDLQFLDKSQLVQKIETIIGHIEEILSTYKTGKYIFDGVNTVIVGRPNVGKSSILNRILKDDRAIVSDIPGTTRDVIKEEIVINGTLFRLYDTAGLRDSNDKIEEEGVKRAKNLISKADLVFFVTDIENSDDRLDKYFRESLDAKTIIKLINKKDLLSVQTLDVEKNSVLVSALTGDGFEDLFEKFNEFIETNKIYTEDSSIISNIRQFNSLKAAVDSLKNAINSLESNQSGEFVALDMRKAINHMKELTGEITSDDVLNAIFSKFCIGK